MWAVVLTAALLAQLDPGAASAAATMEPAVATAAAPAVIRLAPGSALQVEVADGLSSATSKVGDRFALRLLEPVVQDGVVVVPAGAAGEGEVIDAAKKGLGGKQGKLIVAARFLDLNGQRVRVRGMTLQVAGKSRVDITTGLMLVPYAGIAAAFVEGGDIVIPTGTRATVKVAEAVELPATNSLGEKEK